ncbi:MAG: DUF47 family protein [Bacteroidota bacterium]|nr:DUF47 family protein [Bacteroidota bacterium]
MRVLLQDFLSNRGLFFNQLDLAAKNALDMATCLNSIVNITAAEERENLFKQVNRMEHIGDDITHKLNLALDRIIFTPLARNDIHSLAAAMDDVADMIKESGSHIILYNIDECTQPMVILAALILKACVEIQNAVNLLKVNNADNNILLACRQVKQYERQADRTYYTAVAELFLNDKDAINLIKHREILQSLETTVNKCKTAAEVLEVTLINR